MLFCSQAFYRIGKRRFQRMIRDRAGGNHKRYTNCDQKYSTTDIYFVGKILKPVLHYVVSNRCRYEESNYSSAAAHAIMYVEWLHFCATKKDH